MEKSPCVITVFPYFIGQEIVSIHEESKPSYKDDSRKNDLILIMTPEKQDKTLELSKHWSVDSTPARNEVIMKRTYPVKPLSATKSVVIINKCMLL